jgi:Holliday junction resolvase RusA-like endonuclease
MTLFNQQSDVLLDVTLPWTPQVKERPRFTKGGRVYTPKRTLDAEATLVTLFRDSVPDWDPFDQTCRVEWAFSNDQLGILLRAWPNYLNRKLRGDLDNYMKLASDALNGVLYTDDRLIVSTAAVKL